MSVHTDDTSTTAPATLPELATRDEVAAYIRMSARYVARQTADGHLACVRLGRAVRYRREDVDTWLARRVSGGAGR
jgi:excisionase family DNA binding protein